MHGAKRQRIIVTGQIRDRSFPKESLPLLHKYIKLSAILQENNKGDVMTSYRISTVK